MLEIDIATFETLETMDTLETPHSRLERPEQVLIKQAQPASISQLHENLDSGMTVVAESQRVRVDYRESFLFGWRF